MTTSSYPWRVPDQPFHHGHLRAALLAQAQRTIRERGVDALSLRELARQTGVSHAAPRRHFPDRRALLDALAEQGFRRLSNVVEQALTGAGPASADRFRSVARAYVGFAIDEAALMDLMFTRKNSAPTVEVDRAATEFFTLISGVMNSVAPADKAPLADPQRLQRLLISTLHGIASLVGSGRFDRELVNQLVDDAATVFTGASAHGERSA